MSRPLRDRSDRLEAVLPYVVVAVCTAVLVLVLGHALWVRCSAELAKIP